MPLNVSTSNSNEVSQVENNQPEQGALDAVNTQTRELIHHLRSGDIPESVLAQVLPHLEQATELLAPHVQVGHGWSTGTLAEERTEIHWDEADLTRVMPYSPVSGQHNPLSPQIRMWKAGSEVGGEAFFSPVYAGPPDSVHGGVIAAVFDELLSMANVVSGGAGFTGWLTIRYHQKTPLNTPIELFAVNERRDGRKLLSRGEMRVNGEVTASAEGLFIGMP
jgi:hypothetical protein